jgi:hypothetical protein
MKKGKLIDQKVYPKCCMCKYDREILTGVFNKLGGEFPNRLCGAQAHKYQREVFNNAFCQCVFEEIKSSGSPNVVGTDGNLYEQGFTENKDCDLYFVVGTFHSLAPYVLLDVWFSDVENTRAYVVKCDDGNLYVAGYYI